MSLEENKAVIARWADALNRGDYSALDDVFAPDYTHHFGYSGAINREGFKQGASEVTEAFPDLQGNLEHLTAEGDIVSFRWIVTGTHGGTFLGMAPTGKRITYTFNIIARIANGRIQEDWEESDFLGVLQQLGVDPFAALR